MALKVHRFASSGVSDGEPDAQTDKMEVLLVKKSLNTRLYYSISEVAELTDLQPYTLRSWEKEFSCLRPKRVRGKNRAYRERDVGIVLLIKQLLYQDRYTIQGVKQKFKNDPHLLQQASCQATVFFEGRQQEKRAQEARDSAVAAPRAKAKNDLEKTAWEDNALDSKPSLAEAIEEIKKDLSSILRLL